MALRSVGVAPATAAARRRGAWAPPRPRAAASARPTRHHRSRRPLPEVRWAAPPPPARRPARSRAGCDSGSACRARLGGPWNRVSSRGRNSRVVYRPSGSVPNSTICPAASSGTPFHTSATSLGRDERRGQLHARPARRRRGGLRLRCASRPRTGRPRAARCYEHLVATRIQVVIQPSNSTKPPRPVDSTGPGRRRRT